MNTMLLATAVLFFGGIALVVGCIWAYKKTPSYSDWQFVAILGAIAGGLAILIGVCIPAITYGNRAYGRVECRNWSHQTGRPTKFVVYTSWSGGDCLTRSANGKWISKDMLREFGSQP